VFWTYVKRKHLLTAGVLLALATAATAQETTLLTSLRQKLENGVLTFRTVYSGAKLHFDANGAPVGKAVHGVRSLDSEFLVNKVEVTPGKMNIEGSRYMYTWDTASNSLVRSSEKPSVHITLDIPPTTDSEAAIAPVFNKVFVLPRELNAMKCNADEQRTFAEHIKDTQVRRSHKEEKEAEAKRKNAPVAQTRAELTTYCLPLGERAYSVTNGVKPPKAVKQPDPQYSESARKAKVQGTSVYLVRVDEAGLVSDVLLVRSLEPTLNLSGAEALRGWRFEPAIFQGEPVAVLIAVEINFRLY
jgi:TonB family protein